MKKCSQCQKELPETEYYKNGSRLASCCKDCHKQNIKNTYQQKIKTINEYKQSKGCRKCGDARFYVLEFHHPDPDMKDFTISDKIRNKFEDILPEIEKCDVLCANCHREWHFLSSQNNLNYNAWLGETA